MDVDFKNSEFEHLTNTEAHEKCEIAGSTTNTKLQCTEFRYEQNKRFYFPIRWLVLTYCTCWHLTRKDFE